MGLSYGDAGFATLEVALRDRLLLARVRVCGFLFL